MRYKGIVDWFDVDKGFGFISTTEIEDKIFVHWSAIEMEGFKSLDKGDSVSFKVIEGGNGAQAVHVKKIIV